MPVITVRYFAGAKAAAGRESEQIEADSLAELKAILGGREGFGAVCMASSFLVDGQQTEAGTLFPDPAVVDVLPPFAGG